MRRDNRWQVWFAWHPVVIEHGNQTLLVFFEEVMRRRVYLDGKYQWQYALHEGSAWLE